MPAVSPLDNMPPSSLNGAPAGYFIHRAARAEALAHALVAELRRAPPASPFEPLTIVVGSRGMERWLRHRLAMSEAGIAANLRFPFPAEALRESFALGPGAAWQPAALAWAIHEVLPGLLPSPEFAAVRGWLARSTPGPGRREGAATVTRDDLALARELADVIDRAALFRPEWIEAWEAGRDAGPPMHKGPPPWQAALWRALRLAIDEPPPHQALATARALPGPALHVFAVSSMPPLWLGAWQRAGAARPVHAYMLSPTPHYWGDLRTRGELRRDEQRRAAAAGVDEASPHPLLAALGRLARDMHELVVELDPADLDVPGGFDAGEPTDAPRRACLLHWLQDDMAELRGGEELAAARVSRVVAAHDDSVRLHACHGPTRQAEVLREALLQLFERHPDLQPRHVLVMTPDVAAHAPLVQAAFAEGRAARGAHEEGDGWGPVGAPTL
ncbi:MAG: exodeoxyribonuclease V subunit gamma, partial [Deltaproteobacteria bacterium]|nr:exodeoxyribonuclease V subunit gamma [Deltaproteobacteria bacterium]